MVSQPQVTHSDLRRAAIYSYLVRCCLNLTVSALEDVTRVWGLDPEDVNTLGIVSCPPEFTNLIAAGAVAEKFGALEGVDGFYKCGACWWRLDLDPRTSTNANSPGEDFVSKRREVMIAGVSEERTATRMTIEVRADETD
jgi:hypothetical protein